MDWFKHVKIRVDFYIADEEAKEKDIFLSMDFGNEPDVSMSEEDVLCITTQLPCLDESPHIEKITDKKCQIDITAM